MTNKKEKFFDFRLFKRLLGFIKPYEKVFYGVLFSVIVIAVLSASSPFVLRYAIDNNLATQKEEGFLMLIVLMIVMLVFETIFQFYLFFMPLG
jgi:subfamily B ATP-binding cassette protein MsbA